MNDPCDDFLDGGFECGGNDALKDALRRRTARVLSRKRLGRYVALAAMAAACYLAGMATMWLTRAPVVQSPAPIIAENRPAPVVQPAIPDRPELHEAKAVAEPVRA